MEKMEINNLLIRVQELQKSNWLHALHLLYEAKERYPEDPRLSIAQAELYLSRMQYEKALSSYISALAIDPGNQQILVAIAGCYMATGEYRLALAYYQRVVNPADELVYNIALAQAFLGKHYDSIESIKRILPRMDRHPFLYFIIVEQLYRLGKLDEAVEYLDLAFSKAGSHTQLYLLAGVIYGQKNNWLKAYHSYKTADLQNMIGNPDHLMQYAKAAQNIGLLDKAKEILMRAIHANPYVSEVYAELIKIHLEAGDTESAQLVLKLAQSKVTRMSPVLKLLQERLRDS